MICGKLYRYPTSNRAFNGRYLFVAAKKYRQLLAIIKKLRPSFYFS